MTTSHPLDTLDTLDTLEISEQALNTPRKRDQFIKGLMTASVGLAAAAAVAPGAALASSPKALPQSDLAILNFALTLEYLERTFYENAVAQVPFEQDIVRHLALTLRGDEAKHTAAISGIISQNGGTPVGRAKYNFGSAFRTQSDFLKLSQALEDTGVHAYLGQAGNIKTPQVLFDAAAIVTVEARHAGAIRYQLGMSPTIAPFDEGFDKAKILSIAGPFIQK